jgi:alanine racemase
MLNFDTLPRDCWVEIDQSQLIRNFTIVAAHAATPVLAVVKANGYGHGLIPSAEAFVKAGARYLGVATLSEGMMLRDADIKTPLLIICGLLPHDMIEAAKHNIEFFVWRKDHIDALRSVANPAAPISVHLKINTGMGRLGCWPQDAVGIAEELQKISGVRIAGLATHFASAYNPTLPDTNRQIDLFNQVIAALANKNIRPALIHAANSSGAICYPNGRYDMVRIGISLYGVPGDMIPLPEGVGTALSWKARLTSTNILPKGHGVSYSSEYIMERDGRVGIVPVGYADGFQRVPKNVNTVLVRGQERKILGRMCMDQCIVDLQGFDDITGDEIVLIGKQCDKELYIKDVAKRWGTNAHDVYCGLSPRVPRRVVNLT